MKSTVRRRESGALSLVWCAVLVVLLSMALMAGLLSMRYGRNLFADGWYELMGTPLVQKLQKAQSAAESSIKRESAGVRKCTIQGRVLYSNVECGPENPTSRKVDLPDLRIPVKPVTTGLAGRAGNRTSLMLASG